MHSHEETAYQALFKKEFPESYAELTITPETDWKEEYDNCYDINYRIMQDEQKDLIRAIKLLDLDQCREEISRFLDVISKKERKPLLALTISASDSLFFSANKLGLFQWLAKHRPDIAGDLCEEIYAKIVVPSCNNNPEQLLEWAIRAGRGDHEVKELIAAASNPAMIGFVMQFAFQLNRIDVAELLTQKFDPQAILTQVEYYPSNEVVAFLLKKIRPEAIQAHFTEMCHAGADSKIARLLENGVSIRPADWDVVCCASHRTEDHYNIVDIFVKSGATIPDRLLNTTAVKDEGMNAYLHAKAGSLTASDLETYFIRACIKGDIKLAEFLLEKGANPATVDEHGVSAVTHACLSGNFNLVGSLVWQHQVDITPTMQEACRDGNLAIISGLKGSYIIGGYEDTPSEVEAVISACRNGHLAVVSKLLNDGLGGGGVKAATVMRSLCDPFDSAGVEALLLAINNAPDRAMAIDPILEMRNAQITSQLLAVLWSLPGDLSEAGDDHYLYFAKACAYGTTADIERLQNANMTSLLDRSLSYNPNAEVLHYFLDQGADPLKNDQILFNACRTGDTSLVSRLLAAGVSIDQRDSNGLTPLLWACDEEKTEMIKLLLNSGADPNAVSYRQSSPMGTIFASQVLHGKDVEDFPELIKLFIKLGAEPGKILKASEKWDEELRLGTPRLFIDTMLSLIKDENMRDTVTANYKAFRKAVQKGEVEPGADPAEDFYAVKKLVNAINQGVPFDEFTGQRKDGSLALLAEKIFDVDESLYHKSGEMIARLNIIEQLHQVLSAAKLPKASPLALLRDAIGKFDHQDATQLIDHLKEIISKKPGGSLQRFHLHAHVEPRDNAVHALIKALKSEAFDPDAAQQKLEGIKANLGVVSTRPSPVK